MRGPGRRTALTALALAACLLVLTALVLRGSLPTQLSSRLYPLHYKSEIADAADRYQLDPYLVAAVVRAESNFEPEAVSAAGAVGLMQLMPATASWITERQDWQGSRQPELTSPRDNLELGTYYLSYLISKFDGDLSTALAAYNAGHGEVERWLARGNETATAVTIEEIPFRETREFVQRVEHFQALYKQIYGEAF